VDLQQAITDLRAAGVTLHADGDRLSVESRTPLTEQQRFWFRTHKPELLGLAEELGVKRGMPISALDRAAIEEAIEERGAIQEFDGGLSRAQAVEAARAAMRVYRVRVTVPDGGERWATMLAPGCDLVEAARAAKNTFGGDRVLDVVEQQRDAAA
jgi:hypothetical protein